jgi:LuxR family maltose regulon positive regulatory protein
MTFARTKIQPPRPRAGLIDRALERRLADALQASRVSLICAPAGYGKTSLLARAIARLPDDHAVAWFSADEGDDLQGALEGLLEALEPFDPPWRSAPLTLLQRVSTSEVQLRAVAAELINTLEACEVTHGVMVIDDLHRIEDPAFHRFLDALVERIGARWSLAFSTRSDPPLALARLRATSELAEFRQLELRFAQEEARRLADALGLDAENAERALERTQGWPAGLGMVLKLAQQQGVARAWREGERSMFEYLLSEVLDWQRPELAEFLLNVSVLPELDASRCAKVSGHDGAAALLEEIERLGLLSVALDAPTPVVRLHDLFREALQRRLQLQDPARLRNLRRRAAATEPDALRRIAMLIAAEDHEEAARLVLSEVPERLARTGPSSVLHLLAAFPASFRDQSPELLLVRGLVGWVSWDFASMLDLFERARRAFEEAGNASGASLAGAYAAHGFIMAGRLQEAAQLLESQQMRHAPLETRALILNARYWLALDQGRVAAVAGIYAEQLELLRRSSRISLAYQTSPPLRLPGLAGVTGLLAQHGDWLLRVAGDEPTPLRPLGILSHAWVAAWQGRLPDAHRLREQARAEAAWSGDSGAVVAHLLTHAAFTFAMSGDGSAAIAAARERAALQRHAGAWPAYLVAVLVVRIAAACNDTDALRTALAESRALAGQLRAVGTPANEALILPATAQLAWLEGRCAEAQAQWQAALQIEETIDVYGQAVETRLRLANALRTSGDRAAARAVLLPALAAARADQCPGGALLAADALRGLAAAPWHGELAAADIALLNDWAAVVDPVGEATALPESGLSARELEVLARIAAGESNKLIARALSLSPHTVKRHVANILGKLGAQTRAQAVAGYHALPH